MKWILVAYFLSSGFYSEKFVTERDCQDALIEAGLVRGHDLWSAVCTDDARGLDDVVADRDIGP